MLCKRCLWGKQSHFTEEYMQNVKDIVNRYNVFFYAKRGLRKIDNL